MTTIADVVVPAADFKLGKLVVDDPERHIQFERIIPVQGAVLPFFWAEVGDRAAFEAELSSHPEVRDLQRIADDGDRFLYRATWSTDINGVIAALRETNGSILEGKGDHEGWRFRIRFPEHEALQSFVDATGAQGIDVTVNALFHPGHPDTDEKLSETQRETLLLAYERGYFDVPREASLADLAAEFDISTQAVSQRIRRGAANLIERDLVPK